MRLCEMDGCERKHWALGKCKAHYEQLKGRGGGPPRKCSVHICDEPTRRKRCNKHSNMNVRYMREYGITVDDYFLRIERQGGLCPVCRTRPARSLDHDHKTGELRDVLCTQCNVALGQMDDNPAWLRAAADYIERHR